MNKINRASFNMFAGINGAGKTTLYYDELEKGSLFGYRINIDEIVSSFGDWKSEQDQIRATKIAIKQRNAYIKNGYSFNIETTLSGQSIFGLIKTLKEKDYIINLYYVGLENVQLAKDRVEIRMKKGGHFVSSKIIDRRYPKSLKNLSKILPLVDNAYVYDNTDGFELVASKNSGEEMKIFSDVKWLDI